MENLTKTYVKNNVLMKKRNDKNKVETTNNNNKNRNCITRNRQLIVLTGYGTQ